MTKPLILSPAGSYEALVAAVNAGADEVYFGLPEFNARYNAKNFTDEELFEKLKETDYGLCVFHANNDVVDHQVVNMEFEGGITASFTMNCFNEGGRYIRLFGTKGEIFADMQSSSIRLYTFADKMSRDVPVNIHEESILGGHGGGDQGIVRELYDYLSGSYTGYRAADIDTSVKNHFIGFAAEKARHSDTVVDMDAFMKELGFDNTYC